MTIVLGTGEELLQMINDGLDLAKIEAGRQDVVAEEVALASVAAYARAMFEPHAIQKKLAYRVEVADGAPACIVSDSQRVLQILKNLLSNAFKFTEQGSIELRIARARTEDWPRIAEAAVVFEVTDSGIGIDPAQRERIFQAFTQADRGTARRFGGTLDEVSGHPEIDAVLVDAALPGLAVEELARRLRAGTGAPAVVALAGEGERASCEALALDGVLAKPVDPAQLVSVLARVTRRS